MDIKAYISSGILESYLLGGLSDAERQEVEANLDSYPELREELHLIEKGLEDLAQASAVKAPKHLKGKILDQIPESAEEKKEAQSIPLQTKQGGEAWKFLVAASLTLALVAGYLAYDYRSLWLSSSEAYAQLQAQNSQMAEQYNQVNNRLDQLSADLNVMSNDDFRRVNMASVVESANYEASVFWNDQTAEAYLKINTLKALTEEQQYQLWAIVDGQPVDMGVFDIGTEGLIKMKSVQNAAMFAVTIEPKGGSENPTLDAMQVAGEA